VEDDVVQDNPGWEPLMPDNWTRPMTGVIATGCSRLLVAAIVESQSLFNRHFQ
jgi:hypothetical protein